ncbi:MAG: hypothetical protein WCT04_14795 [Planctomycetota bacterium]
MRSIVFSFLFVAVLAIVWTVQTPVSAWWNVNALSRNRSDLIDVEEALIQSGDGAIPFLKRGLNSNNRDEQYHCAKVLMVLGDSSGELFFLKTLRGHPEPGDSAGREAEAFLIAAWDRRNGPNDTLRRRLRAVEHTGIRPIEAIQVLNEALSRYPNWADGYARRARIYQSGGEAYEAKRDAIAALMRAPNHFDALVTLGKIQLAVDAPGHAFHCFERALLVNPRLKTILKTDLDEAVKAMEAEKLKRRDEKRKNAVLV